jgi:signal transduction histidine kinase
MLEGFRDEEWNYIGTKRFGRYTNLPGGEYTLRIKGSNKDGVWNEIGNSIYITVIPPIWMTWWFQGAAVLIIVGGVFAGYWLRIRSVQFRTVELEDQVSSRTKELATLNSIATVVSSSLDLNKILNDALVETLELMQIEAGGIYLLQDSDDVLSIEAYQGLSESFISEIDNLNVGEGFSGRVIQSGEVLVIPEISQDSRLTRSIVKDSGYHTLVVVPLISRGKSLGTLFLLTRDQRAYGSKEIDLLTAIGTQIGGAIENAKHFEDEHRRSEQFRVLAEVGRRVSTILEVNEVLEEVVRLIHDTFGYYHVAIGIIEGDDVVYRVGSGELWDNRNFQFKPARLRVGEEGISGWVASMGKSIVVPDVSKEPRYVWMRGSQTRSEVTVPIIVKGKVIGVLDTQSDRINDFDETDLAVLESLAHQTGSAIENARLYEQAQQAAVLEERARLARELHDAVTQTLFSASLLAEALPTSWDRDQEEGEKLLDELKSLNRGALAEMRTLLIELRPSALIEANFGDLLQQLAEAASGREGLPIEVEVNCACSLPSDVHIALYRIVQEALNNVVKHARASHVYVSLSCSHCSSAKFGEIKPREISLQVIDDGQGFTHDQSHHDKLGLGIMRERAEDIGANFEIESKPGAGTRITVQWQQSEHVNKDDDLSIGTAT